MRKIREAGKVMALLATVALFVSILRAATVQVPMALLVGVSGGGTNFGSGLRSRGVPVEGMAGLIPLGVNEVYWVDTDGGDDSLTGKSFSQRFATIEQFLSVDAARDVCIIMPGTYTIASASLPLTPAANVKFIAAIPSPRPNVVITDDAGGSDTDLVDIEVDNVSFFGVRLLAAHNDVANLVKVADTANVVGLTFEHCWFDGVNFTTVNGIGCDDGTFTTIGLKVSGCRFEEGLVAGISVGVLGIPQADIHDNDFENDAVESGINMADVTASDGTGYAYSIYNNRFHGASDGGADSLGIVIAGADDVAIGVMTGNFFADVGTPVTQDQHDENFGANPVGGTDGNSFADPTS